MVKRKTRSGRVLPEGVSERADGRLIYRRSIHGVAYYIYENDLQEMRRKIAEFELNVAKGCPVVSSKMKLNDWFMQYLQTYKKNKMKESTYHNYVKYYEWYLKDTLIDRIPIKELKRTQVVAHFQDLADKKDLKESTLKLLSSMLHNCLQQCVYDGMIPMNPVDNIMKEIKASPKVEREALTIEETRVLIDFIKLEGTWQSIYLPAIGIGLNTGLRFGELFGLTWREVDLKKGIIFVNHTLHYRDRGKGKHEFFITTPKTASSIRRFPMTEEVKELFEMQRKYQVEMEIRDDVQIDGYKGFVFTTKNGYPFTNESIIRSLKNIIKQANQWEKERAKNEERKLVKIPEITPHIWRHTLATRMVEKGIRPEQLKIIMGHSSIKTTLDVYTHIQEQSLNKVKMDLEGVMNVL